MIGGGYVHLADSLPMGEMTVKTLEGRTAAPPNEPSASPTATEPVRTGLSARLRGLRLPRRPRIWFEVLLIAVSYWVYSLIRNAVPEQKAQALRNADWIWSTEHRLGIAVEQSINHAVDSVTWLIIGMNYYYATLHFIITIGVLVWLFRSHPGRYAASRLVLFATTGVALVGYYFFPLAPPRLMNGGHFIDTVLVHHTWGSMASGDLKNMSNQYAAMPSMHIGWSTWCGLTIFALASAPVGADPGPAVPGGHPDRDRLHGEPLLAGRGGRPALPDLRLPGLPHLVRQPPAPTSASGGCEAAGLRLQAPPGREIQPVRRLRTACANTPPLRRLRTACAETRPVRRLGTGGPGT